MTTLDEIKRIMTNIQVAQSEHNQLLVMLNTKMDLLEQTTTAGPVAKAPKAPRAKAKAKDDDEKKTDKSDEKPKKDEPVKPEPRKISPKRDIDETSEPDVTKLESSEVKPDATKPEEATENKQKVEYESDTEVKISKPVDESGEKSSKVPKTPDPKPTETKSRALNKKEVFKLLYERDPTQFDKWLTADIKAELSKRLVSDKDKRDAYYKHMSTKCDKDLVKVRDTYLASNK